MPNTKNSKTFFKKYSDFFLVFFPTFFVYLLTLYPTVGSEDSGELIVSAATLDIAHPSGYPLHTLLGKLFTILIPFGNIGWRVNLMSAFCGAATITLLYLTLKKLTKHDLLSLGAAFFYAFTDVFWSQSIRAEVYTLNSFFLILIIYLLLLWYLKKEDKYLYLTALSIGLGATNHQLILLAAPPIALFVLVNNWRIILQFKKILVCVALFILGLSVYLYLPIRSVIAPYDNPAVIEHESLATPQKFFNFVNRSIYGGSINVTQESTQEIQKNILPEWLIKISDTFIHYANALIYYNRLGLIPYFRMVSQDLLFFPFILFIPGLYYLIKKFGRYSVFLISLYFFHGHAQLIWTTVSENMHPFSAFTLRPFLIPIGLIIFIIGVLGLKLIHEEIRNKKIKNALVYLFLGTVLIPLGLNFYANNESNNYLAYDFNRNLLESLPPNAYLISTGRDNMTFPLYYLKKIDHIRPDVDLEIYYGRNAVDESFLNSKKIEKNKDTIFLDILPPNYLKLHLAPYNFVFVYGQLEPKSAADNFKIRGIRKTMDYPNNRLKGIYYLKLVLADPTDLQKMDYYFNKIATEIPENDQLNNFIKEYRQNEDYTGMF